MESLSSAAISYLEIWTEIWNSKNEIDDLCVLMCSRCEEKAYKKFAGKKQHRIFATPNVERD